jgi:hypothetical protein
MAEDFAFTNLKHKTAAVREICETLNEMLSLTGWYGESEISAQSANSNSNYVSHQIYIRRKKVKRAEVALCVMGTMQ